MGKALPENCGKCLYLLWHFTTCTANSEPRISSWLDIWKDISWWRKSQLSQKIEKTYSYGHLLQYQNPSENSLHLVPCCLHQKSWIHPDLWVRKEFAWLTKSAQKTILSPIGLSDCYYVTFFALYCGAWMIQNSWILGTVATSD